MHINIHLKCITKLTQIDSNCHSDLKFSKLHRDEFPLIQNFKDKFTEIKNTIINHIYQNGATKKHCDYFEEMLSVTCLGGKHIRGMTIYEIVHYLAYHNSKTEIEFQKYCDNAIICGWILEIMQAHFLVIDDVMDESITRRGKPCWYKYPGVNKTMAICDGLFLMPCYMYLIKYYFSNNPDLKNSLLDLLFQTELKTCLGQFYDISSMIDEKELNPHIPLKFTSTYEGFTEETYNRIVEYKTVFYTFFCPLEISKFICAKWIKSNICIKEFSFHMGHYFQVTDDYLDCFVDPETSRKIGTDIQDQKCTWLAIQFLSNATRDDINLWIKNYGSWEDKKVEVIKHLYIKYNLPNIYSMYQQKVKNKIETLLDKMNDIDPMFTHSIKRIWKKIYKRIY